MTPNIALAQQLAKERQQEITQYAEQWRRVRESFPAREPWWRRLLRHHDVTGATIRPARAP